MSTPSLKITIPQANAVTDLTGATVEDATLLDGVVGAFTAPLASDDIVFSGTAKLGQGIAEFAVGFMAANYFQRRNLLAFG